MINFDNQGTYVHFSKAEEFIFSFFYSTKLHTVKLPNALNIFILIVQSLQLFFLPLKRSDVQDIGITFIVKTVGLYLDPSFYIPSNISHIVMVGVISTIIITSITLHIITYVLDLNDAKIPDDLLHIVQVLNYLIVFVLQHSLVGIFTKSIVCYLPQKSALDPIDINLSHCSYALLDHIILIIGIIGLLYLCIYGYFTKFFTFQGEMIDPSITDCRRGIFPAFSHVIVAIAIAVQTFLVEYSPIISAFVQIAIFALLGIYVILSCPYMKLQSNQIHSAMYIGASAGGPISLILSGLNILAQHGNNNIDNYEKTRGYFELILAIIIFYSILIITFVIFFWGATVLAKKSAISKWIIKPVYEWRDVSYEEESVIRESYFKNARKVIVTTIKNNPKSKAQTKQRQLLQRNINASSTASLSLYNTSSTASFVPLSESEQQIDAVQQEIEGKKWKMSFEKRAKKRHIRKFMVGVTLKVEKGNKAIIYSVEPTLLQTISGNVPQPKAPTSPSGPSGKKIQIPNPVLKAKQANLLVLAKAKAKQGTLSIISPSSLSMKENAFNDDQSQQTSPLTSQITSLQPQSNSQPKSITTPKIKAKPKSAFPSSTTPKTSINSFSAKTKGVQAKPKSIDQKKVSTSVALSGPKKQVQLVERQSIGAILCSHPDLKWTKQLLLATPATAFSLLKQYDNPSKLEQGIRFMQIPELYNHKLIVPFSFVIVNTALKKDVFKLSADHHVSLALFLNAFRPNQIKIAALLQQAANLFPGWSNRWIIFKMMREIESSNQSDSQQTDEQRKDGIQPQSLDSHSTSYVMRNMMTQASKSFLLARAHTLRVFQLLTRRTVDVERVIFHSCKAATNTKIAEDLFRQLSESNPDNPNILRQFSALVRDIHGDKKLSADILAEAEQVEEEQAKITARLLKQRMDKLKLNKQLIGVNKEDISRGGATHAALAANVFMQGAKIGFSNQGDQHWLQQLDNDSNDNKDNQQDANNENTNNNKSRKLNKKSTTSAIKNFKNKANLQRNKKEQQNEDVEDNENGRIKNNSSSKSSNQGNLVQSNNEQQIDNFIFIIMYISIFIIIGLFIFCFIFINILFTNGIETTSVQRNVLSLSEKMSSAVSYSIYTMFRILSKDSSGELDDEGDSYSIIYQSGFDSTNKTLFEINELFGQVYHYDFNNKMWIDNIVEWNILTFTYPESSVGNSNPIFTITNSTVDNMNIPRFVSWIEDSIMRMVDDFANISQVDQLGIIRTPFTTMKEHFAELLFNQPFVGAESMKRICVIALDDLFSTQVEGYIIIITFTVISLIILMLGIALPLLFTIKQTKKHRIEAMKDLCAVTQDQAQTVFQQIDEQEVTTQIPSKTNNLQFQNNEGTILDSYRGGSPIIQSARSILSPTSLISPSAQSQISVQFSFRQQQQIPKESENSNQSNNNQEFDRQSKITENVEKISERNQQQSNNNNLSLNQLQLSQDLLFNDLPLDMKLQILKKHEVKFDDIDQDQKLKKDDENNNNNNQNAINNQQNVKNQQIQNNGIDNNITISGIMNTYQSISNEEERWAQNSVMKEEEQQKNKNILEEQIIELKEKEEQVDDEFEEKKRIAQVRAEDVNKCLRKTRQIIPQSIKIRLFLGILLTIIISIPNLIVTIYALYGLGGQSGHFVINQLRIQNFVRISVLISAFTSDIIYKSPDSSFLIPIQSVNSTVFKNNGYATDTITLRNDIQLLNNVLTYQNNKFQLGSSNVQASGDRLTDMVVNPRSQGKNDFINQIMSDETECLIPDDVDLPESIYSDQETGTQRCKNQERMPGLQYPFKGLEQLLNIFQEAIVELLTMEPGDIAIDNTDFNYIIESARNDIYYGLFQINNYLSDELDKYHSTYSAVLIVVFILVIVGLLLISIVIFIPLPSSLNFLSEQTEWILSMRYTVDERLKHFSEVEFDSELVTEVPRVDESHILLYKSMSVIVNELHEQKETFSDAIYKIERQMKKMNSSVNKSKTPIPVQESEIKVNSSPARPKTPSQKSNLQQLIGEIEQSSQILDLNLDIFIWRTMSFFCDQEKLMERLGFRELFMKQHSQDHINVMRKILTLSRNIIKQFKTAEQALINAIDIFQQQDFQVYGQEQLDNDKQIIKSLPSPSSLSQFFVKLFPDHIMQFDMEFALSLQERAGKNVQQKRIILDDFQESRFMHQFIESSQDVSMIERMNYANKIRRIKSQIKEFKENTTKNKEKQQQSQKNKNTIEISTQQQKNQETLNPQQQIYNPLSVNSFQPNQSPFTNYSPISQSLSSQQQQNQQTPQLFFNPSQIPQNFNFNNFNNNFNQQHMIIQNFE